MVRDRQSCPEAPGRGDSPGGFRMPHPGQGAGCSWGGDPPGTGRGPGLGHPRAGRGVAPAERQPSAPLAPPTPRRPRHIGAVTLWRPCRGGTRDGSARRRLRCGSPARSRVAGAVSRSTTTRPPRIRPASRSVTSCRGLRTLTSARTPQTTGPSTLGATSQPARARSDQASASRPRPGDLATPGRGRGVPIILNHRAEPSAGSLPSPPGGWRGEGRGGAELQRKMDTVL